MAFLPDHSFWIASRAAGISAMLLASLSIALGLAMALRLGGGRLADRRVLHEALSLGTMACLVVHAGALLFDAYLAPSLADVTIPFVSGYETAWTSLGIVSGWTLVLSGLAFYARRRIGLQRWKVVHRLTVVAWVGGLVHALGEGTDTGQAWFVALLVLAIAPTLVLLGLRLAGRLPLPSTPQGAPR